MAAISDYLEQQLLEHIFRGTNFAKPDNISIALTSSVAKDNQNGSNIPEIPTGVTVGASTLATNYNRLSLGAPSEQGDTKWFDVGLDANTTYQVHLPESGTVYFSNNNGETFSTSQDDGYWYPLYAANSGDSTATESAKFRAENSDTNSQSYIFRFDEYPGVNFYSPRVGTSSGVAADGGNLAYEGNGFIKNQSQIVFQPAFRDWGFVSGIAVLDNSSFGVGNLLMYAQLRNPRYIYTGDQIKFDVRSLEISLT